MTYVRRRAARSTWHTHVDPYRPTVIAIGVLWGLTAVLFGIGLATIV